jgi:hypothetical protein
MALLPGPRGKLVQPGRQGRRAILVLRDRLVRQDLPALAEWKVLLDRMVLQGRLLKDPFGLSVLIAT